MFVRAVYYREKKTVHYFDENGAETLYIGGSFAWRMNNPGNMAKPGKRVVHDVIGYAQRTSDPKSVFLIFKDRAAGERERVKLMREVYGKSTISEMMHRYAPPHENDTAAYIAFICKRASVTADDVVGKLSEKQFNDVVAAIGKHEGYAPGKIVELGKPAKAELRDVVQQPIANQPVQVKSGEHVLDTKTDHLGQLPPLYPDLFKLDLSFYHAAMADKPEKIGMLAPSAFSSDVTFVAPYFVLQSQPKVHETKHPERPSVHVVRAGQTLSKIAAMYPGLTAEAIAGENNLKDVNKIFERQHLRLPAGSAAAPAPTPPTTPPAAPAKPATPPPVAPAPARRASTPAASANHPSQASVPTPSHPPAAAKPPAPAKKPAPPKPKPAVAVQEQRSEKQHPVTLVSTPTLELSGKQWCARFPGSSSLDSLEPGFGAKAKAFIAALKAAGVGVSVNAAHRPTERSYLMYYAWRICKGDDVTKIPPYPGVPIDWAHRDAKGNPNPAAAKKAAEAMCKGYGLKPYSPKQLVGKPGKSNHNKRLAVDISLSNYVGKTVVDKNGEKIKVKSFATLVDIGETYEVLYFPKENMHWSHNGR